MENSIKRPTEKVIGETTLERGSEEAEVSKGATSRRGKRSWVVKRIKVSEVVSGSNLDYSLNKRRYLLNNTDCKRFISITGTTENVT